MGLFLWLHYTCKNDIWQMIFLLGEDFVGEKGNGAEKRVTFFEKGGMIMYVEKRNTIAVGKHGKDP